MLETIKKRLSNKLFLASLAMITYQVISKYCHITFGEYQVIFDVISYVIIGHGVYTNYEEGVKNDGK